MIQVVRYSLKHFFCHVLLAWMIYYVLVLIAFVQEKKRKRERKGERKRERENV